jgi:hypothetical protein
MSSESRQAKRARQTRITEDSFHDLIPTGDDFDTMNHQEAGQDVEGRYFLHPSVQHHSTWTIGSTWVEDNSELSLDYSGAQYDTELLDDTFITHAQVPDLHRKRKRQKNARSQISVSFLYALLCIHILTHSTQRRVHKVWTEKYRSEYLDELIRHEGRGDFRHEIDCNDCVRQKVAKGQRGKSIYRCKDCYTPDLVCDSCCVRRHELNPFHRIEVRLLWRLI